MRRLERLLQPGDLVVAFCQQLRGLLQRLLQLSNLALKYGG